MLAKNKHNFLRVKAHAFKNFRNETRTQTSNLSTHFPPYLATLLENDHKKTNLQSPSVPLPLKNGRENDHKKTTLSSPSVPLLLYNLISKTQSARTQLSMTAKRRSTHLNTGEMSFVGLRNTLNQRAI